MYLSGSLWADKLPHKFSWNNTGKPKIIFCEFETVTLEKTFFGSSYIFLSQLLI